MLFDADVQRYIISLRPPSQWMEEEDWFLVATINELGLGVLEEEDEKELGQEGKKRET